MATDRDEQQRQQQELEEIRRSFAEMGARMGSLFEPAEAEEPQRPHQSVLPPAPAIAPQRPRWRLAAILVLLFLAGTTIGWVLPRGDGGSAATPPPATATTAPPGSSRSTAETRPPTVVSVPDECLETAELGDEVIARLNRNIRDERLFLALRDYTIASQACRREASR
jgi:hypothetical protein